MSPNPQTAFPPTFATPLPREKSSNEKHDEGAGKFKHQVLPVVQTAVRAVTEKECTGLFDVQPSALSEAVSGTSTRGRTVPLEWFVQLLVHAPVSVKLALLEPLCDLAGCKPPERKEELKVEDELRILRDFASRVPGGTEWVEREKDRYRP